jgi:CheY-like chemotaxis protein
VNRATVLIADDSPDIRTIMKYSLSDNGYTVVEATDGHEAVRLARQCRPVLILLDLCMPGIDGWEVANRLRGDPALEEVPIIAMTAYDVSSAVRAAFMAGCQQVIAKPFDLDEVTKAVAALISKADLFAPQYA